MKVARLGTQADPADCGRAVGRPRIAGQPAAMCGAVSGEHIARVAVVRTSGIEPVREP